MSHSTVRSLLLGFIAVIALGCASSASSVSNGGTSGAGASGSRDASAGASSGGAPDAATFDPPPVSGYHEMNIYPGNPPNYLATAPAERVDATTGFIYDVSIPTLRRYPVDESKSSGVGFIVFPGGGYSLLDMETHATALAERLGPLGIAVFGLKYRVGSGSNDVRRDALLDAQRAVRLVRSRAAEWHLDPRRIGTVSWSAGSHLALTLGGHFDAGQPTSSDPVDRMSCRPDFMAVMCPWADGQSASPFTFLATTPPTYICHAEDDTTAPIALAYAVEKQLQSLAVLEHLEVYATGGHDAFNVGVPTAPGRDWPDKYLPWLQSHQLTP